ncbi:unnamed protein product [Paramecium sonneborni]|uniref:EGF-like domain-containing protein n=1 Tax=Paramecium sonneborni TaxID=65129 RepID=A0A8S1KAP6_9CILI|nr:unnamed protein product [Paramecium sonneborni]
MELFYISIILLMMCLSNYNQVSSQIIYDKLTYYLDTSTSAQNITCQSLTKVYQSSTIGSPRVMQFKINTNYGYTNLFYIFELHFLTQQMSNIIFQESGVTVYTFEANLIYQMSTSFCSKTSFVQYFQFTSVTNMNEQQATLLITSNSESTFFIKNLNIYAERCQPYCKICIESQNCQECMPDYEFNTFGFCQCKYQFLTNFQGQCITQCPINHIFNGYTCEKYNQLINLLYDDTASKFTMIPDYNTTQRLSKTTLEGKQVAGLFIQNEAVEYQINLSSETGYNIILLADMYLLNFPSISINFQLSIKYNNIIIGQIFISLKNEINQIQVIGAIKQKQCNIKGFTTCLKFTIGKYIQNIKDLSLLQLQMNIPLERQEISWAISQIQVSGITLPPINCPLKKFENECFDECPITSRAQGDECISILNDYKFTQVLRISYTDRFSLKQNTQINYICDLWEGLHFVDCVFYQKRYLFGGYNIWQNEQIKLVVTTIKPHYKVKLLFKLIIIDPVDSNQSLIVGIEDTVFVLNKNSPNSYCFSSVATSDCIIQEDLGQTNADYLINFDQEFDHSKTQLEIFLNCNIQQNSNSYCAIYDLIILQANCPDNCQFCLSDSNCLQNGQIIPVLYDCLKDGYYYSEGSCQQCQNSCKTCKNQSSCTSCKDSYFQFGNLCICKMNQVSAEISDCQDNNCHSSCSKCQNQISQNYVRTVSYMNSFCSSCDRNEHKIFNTNICECFLGYYMEKTINPNTCQLCNSKCKTCSDATTCITCYPEQNRIYNDYQCQCKEGYFDNEYDSSCIKCITLCKSCLYKQNHCIDCHPEQYRILSKENKCICQNGYYDNQNDVCLKCNDNCYSCTNYYTCTSCNEFDFRKLDVLNKICICQLGYYDNNEQTCLPCYYTCSKCNNQNLPSQCTLCPKTRQKSSNNLDTFECQCRKGYFDDGYLECLPCINLINPPISHYCYSFCGDLIVQWNEECDDGNLDQRDGCNQCFLQNNNCKENVCLKCQYNKCLQCIDGYYLNNDYACIQCSYECQTCETRQNNCTSCKFHYSNSNKCLICNQDQGFFQIDNQCFSICGDGIKTFQEFCDDGNQLNGDGCDQNCNIEVGYVCNTQCQQINYLQILLKEYQFHTIYDSKRIIQLKFNQDVKITTNSSITNLIQVISTTANLNMTLISISDNSEVKNDYINTALDLNIQLESSALSPTLKVIIQNYTYITNQQGCSFQFNNATIQLIEYIQQDKFVIQNTQNLTQISSYFLYILLGLVILAFVFGGLDIFWNLLDTLQFICYLKYFNITYPYNLQYYFTIFGFAEFDFIKSYFDFEYLITQYVDTPQADPKFYQEGYSTVFLVNIISVIIVFITYILTFILIKIVLYLLHKITKDFSEEIILMESEKINIFTFLFYKFTNNCQKYFMQIISEFKSALIRTFMTSAYDFNLAIFLQFKDFNFDNPILKLSSICAIIVFFLEIYFLFNCLSLMSKDVATYKLQVTKQNYGSLYEGLKLNRNHFIYYFNLFIVIKKGLFMALLVFLYNTPTLQISLVSLLSLSQVLFLFLNKPLEDQNEHVKQIICEIILWLSEILILVISYNEQSQNLNFSSIINIGWSIIGFLSLIIFAQLIIDCKQHFKFLNQKYQLLKHFKIWYHQYFQNDDSQSSLNTEYSQFSIIFQQKPKQLQSIQKSKALNYLVNQRRIFSFKLN